MRTAAEYGHRKAIAFQGGSLRGAEFVMLSLWAVLGFALYRGGLRAWFRCRGSTGPNCGRIAAPQGG
jgi:hypothetical protein